MTGFGLLATVTSYEYGHNVLSLLAVLIGFALLFGIPAWAAWTTFEHRYRAAVIAVNLTGAWVYLMYKLAT